MSINQLCDQLVKTRQEANDLGANIPKGLNYKTNQIMTKKLAPWFSDQVIVSVGNVSEGGGLVKLRSSREKQIRCVFKQINENSPD